MVQNVTNERKRTIGFKVSDHEHNIYNSTQIFLVSKILRVLIQNKDVTCYQRMRLLGGFIITKAKIYMTMKLLHQTENVISDKIW
jgi:hypothetical protein